MSNYIKYNNYVQPNTKTVARVINSNPKMEAMIREWTKADSANADGFSEGIFAETIISEPTPSPEEILEEAKLEAERILEEARIAADAMAKESQLMAQNLYEEHKQRGFEEGKQEAEALLNEQVDLLQAELNEKEQELRAAFRERADSLENDIVEALATVLEKTFHVFVQDEKDVLIFLIRKTIEGIDSGKNFKIRVAMENAKFVSDEIPKFREELGADAKIEVLGDKNLSDNDCILETDYGVYHCGIDLQLSNLLRKMKALSIS